MRTPSRWFTRRVQHLFSLSPSGVTLRQRTTRNAGHLPAVSSRLLPSLQACHASSLRKSLHGTTPTSGTITPSGEAVSQAATFASREPERVQKLSTWMSYLNISLPQELRIAEKDSAQSDNTKAPVALDFYKLEKTFQTAKQEANTDVLLWLVDNGYRKTAVWLMEAILDCAATEKKELSRRAPSNIDWPNGLFKSIGRSPLNKLPTFQSCRESVYTENQFEPAVYPKALALAKSRLLMRVWEALGTLIVNSAHADTDDTMDDNMLTALLVLAYVHKLGMMPDDVYTFTRLDRPTHAQRPPILNLVSSRILAALSDVTWRQQQDDAISEAARKGMSLKQISKNVPGGRFRLKVRPLAPEIWLELILWCCIESNQVDSALAIIAKLAAQTEEPWFAIRWTSIQSREKLSSLIDWDRVQLRYGGTAGLIEGYSREKPFVNVPDKTISIEVVLALVEKLLASVASSSLHRVNSYIVHKDFRPLRRTMSDIQDVMTFLEPHDLDTNYLDYLESRLLQDGAFDLPRAPVDLYTWTTHMRSIRDLESTRPKVPVVPNLQLKDIQAHSQLHIGLQHQAFSSLVEFGDVHHTLAILNEIQESIDHDKVASITTFLHSHQSATTNDLPLQRSIHDLEFTNCHGQLPYYKLAGLLNLISNTDLVGLGRWMLYAQEVDGAALPESVWGLPCMTAALYRFASASSDEDLLEAARFKRPPKMLPSVKMLRTLADTNMRFLRLQHATRTLESLRSAKGGGFGLSNVANVAATILRLEQREPKEVEPLLRKAVCLLEDILVTGCYSTVRSDFTVDAQQLFKRQIHHIIVVFRYFRGSILESFANRHAAKFPYSNLALLPAQHFNVLLAAGIETYGAAFGRKMWHRFCKIPDTPYAAEMFDLDVETLQDLIVAQDSDEPDLLSESDVSKSFGVPSAQISTNDRQHGPSGTDEDLIQFDDPFFPKQLPDVVEGFQAASIDDTDTSVPFEEDASHTARPGTGRPPPLVIPNLNTLRLITRAAVRELKSREEASLSTEKPMEQLAWAVKMFEAFGVFDRTVVEQEIQFPLSEINSEILEEANKAIEADKDYIAQSAMEQDLSAGSPVSEIWLPNKPVSEFLNYN